MVSIARLSRIESVGTVAKEVETSCGQFQVFAVFTTVAVVHCFVCIQVVLYTTEQN
jgi:hypothetical protein